MYCTFFAEIMPPGVLQRIVNARSEITSHLIFIKCKFGKVIVCVRVFVRKCVLQRGEIECGKLQCPLNLTTHFGNAFYKIMLIVQPVNVRACISVQYVHIILEIAIKLYFGIL